jgi:nucleotide-binding universal stress UspA family protein
VPLFHNLLAAADFSAPSFKAFNVACSLAGERDAALTVLHIIEPALLERAVEPGSAHAPIYQPAGGQERAVYEHLREVYVPEASLDIEYHVGEGKAAEEILRTALERHCDLIVMGTHGRKGLRRVLAGSVAESVLREAPCPVLAVRTPENPWNAPQVQTILHPVDLSDESEHALQIARALARDLGARLILLHVAPIEVLMNGTMAVGMSPHVYRDALHKLRERIDGPDLKYVVESRLERGEAGDEVIRVADETACDLIVMGTHARTRLHRMLLGSVAESVLRRARCPVLAVKTPAGAVAESQLEPIAL